MRLLDALRRSLPRASPGRPGDPGLIGPGSAAWRTARERALLAGGPAALLLQVAHPLVAAGVAAHSDFARDPLRRLNGTLDAVLTATFGDTEQARAAARRVARRHRPVRGTLPVATGGVPAGAAYDARDPALALWVHATLVWSAVAATEAFVRPVPLAERDAYHRDMAGVAELFGVPRHVLPPDWDALEVYVDQQCRTVLAVEDVASRLAHQVLLPDRPVLPRPLRGLPGLLAAGLLPPAVREAYGLPWGRPERAAFTGVRRVVRGALPVLPPPVRYWPHHRAALRRAARPAQPQASRDPGTDAGPALPA